jgi:hypothetical protein
MQSRQPRRRVAKGPPRPQYLDSPDLDRVTIMLVAVVSEMLAMQDRLDTHEILLERDGALTKAAMARFRPSPEEEAAREQKRLAILRRVFRVLRDELETDNATVGGAP